MNDLYTVHLLLESLEYKQGDTKREFGGPLKEVLFYVKDKTFVYASFYEGKLCECVVNTYKVNRNYNRPPNGMKEKDLVEKGFDFETTKVCRDVSRLKEYL